MQQLALSTRIKVRRQTGLLDDPARDGVVKVVAAQGAVASRGQNFKHTAGQTQDRDIERTATQVIDRNNAFSLLVQTVSHCRSRRLVEQA